MFCTNCGNRIDENAYICVNCGVILKGRSSQYSGVHKKNNSMVFEIFSVVFGVLSFFASIMLFLNDISSVGMYTEIFERVMFAFGYSLVAILFALLTLTFSLLSKKVSFKRCGLVLSLLSFFFIITEFIVIIIY